MNAARVLTGFGAKAIAILPSGGEAGKTLEAKLRLDGFETVIVPVDSNVRTNLTITDRQGLLCLRFNERGPALSKKDMDSLAQSSREACLPDQQALALVCAAACRPVSIARFCAHLSRICHPSWRADAAPITDGDALLYGIEANPTARFHAPNQSEAERLLNRALITRSHSVETRPATFWRWAHSQWFCPLGSRGAIAASAAGTNEGDSRRASRLSVPIGAGDALCRFAVT